MLKKPLELLNMFDESKLRSQKALIETKKQALIDAMKTEKNYDAPRLRTHNYG